MTIDEIKDLVLFMKREQVSEFKINDIAVIFSGAAVLGTLPSEIESTSSEDIEDDELLYAST